MLSRPPCSNKGMYGEKEGEARAKSFSAILPHRRVPLPLCCLFFFFLCFVVAGYWLVAFNMVGRSVGATINE